MTIIAKRYASFDAMKRDEYRYWQARPTNTRFRTTLNWSLEIYRLKDARITTPDYIALLTMLEKHEARYLIVGGYAVSYHSQPRPTKDLDIWIAADADNAPRVYAALAKYGAPIAQWSPADFAAEGEFFRFGREPLGLDVLTSIPGISFAEAWPHRIAAGIAGTALQAFFISREDLIAAKRAAGRLQDLADIEAIETATEP